MKYFNCTWPILHQIVAILGQLKNNNVFIYMLCNIIFNQSSVNWFEWNHVWNHNSWRPKRAKRNKRQIQFLTQYVVILMKSKSHKIRKYSFTVSSIPYHMYCDANWRNGIRSYCLYIISIRQQEYGSAMTHTYASCTYVI